MVEDLLAPLEPFAAVDVLRAQAAVESHVPVIVEDREVLGRDHTSLIRRLRQVSVVIRELAAQVEPSLVLVQPRQDLRVSDFLTAGLHRKVGLAQRDDFLLWVGVLDDQVAGVTGERIIFHPPLAALADGDHFREVTKMIGRSLTTIPARPDRASNRLIEVLLPSLCANLCKHRHCIHSSSCFIPRCNPQVVLLQVHRRLFRLDVATTETPSAAYALPDGYFARRSRPDRAECGNRDTSTPDP